MEGTPRGWGRVSGRLFCLSEVDLDTLSARRLAFRKESWTRFEQRTRADWIPLARWGPSLPGPATAASYLGGAGPLAVRWIRKHGPSSAQWTRSANHSLKRIPCVRWNETRHFGHQVANDTYRPSPGIQKGCPQPAGPCQRPCLPEWRAHGPAQVSC